jgi:hypothetical protein
MAWWALAAAGASMATSMIGAGSSRRLGRKAAALQRAETDEAVRRFGAEAQGVLSTTKARGAASGIEADSSSLTTYLSGLAAEFKRQQDWMRDAGYRGARLTAQGANARFIGDVGQSLYAFGASQNWWRGSGSWGAK